MTDPLTQTEEIESYRQLVREFKRLEAAFLELVDYVPLSPDRGAPNYSFGSPRAAILGLDTCTLIETALRTLLLSPRWDEKGAEGVLAARDQDPNIDVYRRAFEPQLELSKARLLPIGSSLEIAPFQSFEESENPEWFRKYSRLKHDRLELARSWNLMDTLESLAALGIVLYDLTRPGMIVDEHSSVFQGLLFATNPFLLVQED